MARVSVRSADEEYENEASFADDDVDDDPTEDKEPRRRRKRRSHVEVEIEREVTKRAMIESATRLLVVILYMAFTLMRERDAGVVALDPDDEDLGPEDDWDE
jgi:hypothetical protein